jgi:hypothetical protein
MKDAFETLNHMYIMMECIQGGELFDHIKDYEINGKTNFLLIKHYRKRSSLDCTLDPRGSSIPSSLRNSSPRFETREYFD